MLTTQQCLEHWEKWAYHKGAESYFAVKIRNWTSPPIKGLRLRNDASEASVPLLFAWTEGQMRKFVISKAEFELGLKELALDLYTMDVDSALNLFHGRLLERSIPIKTKYDN